MTALTPAWIAPWDATALGEEAFDALVSALASTPCPVLEPATGACLIHASRPSTCRLMGMGVITADGDQLENACPIQDVFPGYPGLPPVRHDLEQTEAALDGADVDAWAAGWVTTTIAGAIGHP